MLIVLVLLVVCHGFMVSCQNVNPSVSLPDNCSLEGNKVYFNDDVNQNPNTNIVDEYLGVPYAKAPVGDLRFRAPEARVFDHPTELNSKHLAPSCYQSIVPLDTQIIGNWWNRSILVILLERLLHKYMAYALLNYLIINNLLLLVNQIARHERGLPLPERLGA